MPPAAGGKGEETFEKARSIRAKRGRATTKKDPFPPDPHAGAAAPPSLSFKPFYLGYGGFGGLKGFRFAALACMVGACEWLNR